VISLLAQPYEKPSCRDLAIFEPLELHWVALKRSYARWNRTTPKGNSYWYLHDAGVRPEHQGKGWGSAVILQGLTRARSEELPVYLETAKESNVGLYRRLGFKLVGEWDVPEGGPLSGPCLAKIET
jgi:GNAT superfamily N-acetyltransferase